MTEPSTHYNNTLYMAPSVPTPSHIAHSFFRPAEAPQARKKEGTLEHLGIPYLLYSITFTNALLAAPVPHDNARTERSHESFTNKTTLSTNELKTKYV